MYFLETKNVKIGRNMMKSNFLDSKGKSNYMRYTRVGKRFYEHHSLLRVVKGMMVDY